MQEGKRGKKKRAFDELNKVEIQREGKNEGRGEEGTGERGAPRNKKKGNHCN